MLSGLVDRDGTRVYLACGPTDMRKSIDALAAIVTYSFELDPLGPGLFVLCNRERDKIKILFWENNSFWLYYRHPAERAPDPLPDSGGCPLGVGTASRTCSISGLPGPVRPSSLTTQPLIELLEPVEDFAARARVGAGACHRAGPHQVAQIPARKCPNHANDKLGGYPIPDVRSRMTDGFG